MRTWGKATRKVYVLSTVALLALAGVLGATPGVARAQENNAVVLMYHRFGEGRLPSTNIRLDQFEAHIAELTSGAYNVLPLEEVAKALRDGTPLPDRTVAITVDDAFLSIYTEAWPRLRDAGLPFTVFVSTDPVDEGRAAYMTWDQLRELVAAGVSIGNHTASHLHMADASPEQNAAAIARSRKRFQEELGIDPVLFAYPYGEASLEVRKIVVGAGFETAFGQHSGVTFTGHDPLYLPRFSFNENFSGMDRFRLIVNALPLPTQDVTPADMMLDDNRPAFGFTVDPAVGDLSRLNCFVSGQENPATIQRLGDTRFEVRADEALRPGRNRFNCTLLTREGRWRWFGMQYYLPK